jgi:ribosome modulation factor
MGEKSDYGKGYQDGLSNKGKDTVSIIHDAINPFRDKKSDDYKEGYKDGQNDRKSK